MENITKQTKGFSLIELLVVTAILSVLGLVSATIISSILSGQNRTLVSNVVKQNGDHATQIFERDVKEANTAVVNNCSGPDECRLELTNSSGGQISTWICLLEGSNKRVLKRQTSAQEQYITSPDDKNGTNVDTCQGIFVVSGSEDNLVTIDMLLRNAVGLPDRAEFQTSIEFKLTVGMRSKSF